jgi:hypothetical protein
MRFFFNKFIPKLICQIIDNLRLVSFYLKELRIAQCRLIAVAEDTTDSVKPVNINQIPDKTNIEQRSVQNSAPLIAVTFYRNETKKSKILCNFALNFSNK